MARDSRDGWMIHQKRGRERQCEGIEGFANPCHTPRTGAASTLGPSITHGAIRMGAAGTLGSSGRHTGATGTLGLSGRHTGAAGTYTGTIR